MLRLFAFLRAINAGPRRVVRMKVLLQVFESLGFSGAATFLGSGNVVFETRARNIRALERKIEQRLQQSLGYGVPVFIRTHAELKEIAALNPFGNSLVHGADVNVILLADSLDAVSKTKVMALTTDTDGFCVRRREIYWWRLKRPGTSLYSTVPLERALTQPFTIRSRNTMRRLAARWP
jgi:uncharacterized protein (DUF1697 family)